MSSLLVNFETVSKSYALVEPILNTYLSKQEIDIFSSNLREKLTTKQPRIMVYGVYNAGKSTLLNALMGKEEAKVSDRPETSTITPYAWNGYTLLDTPGIDAPAADEKMAREELDRSDVVLFVIALDGTSIEELSTWKELVAILNRGRKVFIILNNKKGLKPDSDDFIKASIQLTENLKSTAKSQGYSYDESNISYCFVNARTALKGRIENKQALVEYSGILTLENALADFLSSCDGYDVLNSACQDLIGKIELTENKIQIQHNDEIAQTLTRLQQDIDHVRSKLSITMNDELDRLLLNAKGKMVRAIEQIAETGNSQQNAQNAISEEASNISMFVGKELNNKLILEFKNAQQELRKIEVSLQEGKLGDIGTSFNANFNHQQNTNKEDNSELMQVAKDAFAKMPISNLTETGTKMALEFGKKTLPELFKGIGKQTMGKWAGVAGRWVGPVIQVGTMLYGLYQANKQEEEERRAYARMHQAIQDAASDFVNELKFVYRQQLQQAINTMFEPLDNYLLSMEKEYVNQNKTIQSNIKLLQQEKQKLQQMV
jgi:small GTP-binding protein